MCWLQVEQSFVAMASEPISVEDGLNGKDERAEGKGESAASLRQVRISGRSFCGLQATWGPAQNTIQNDRASARGVLVFGHGTQFSPSRRAGSKQENLVRRPLQGGSSAPNLGSPKGRGRYLSSS